MIQDRIVVGLQDTSLSEKLQLDPDLTLQKAVTTVQQSETVKKQQATVRRDNPSVDRVKKFFKDKKAVPSTHAPQNDTCIRSNPLH